ncbi:MAG: carbon storage regulator [Pirellulales bacterium]|nr:carbon storage regulator [Pirellulales bacterium]MBX3434797.1 carbon storage regulator [Pirellulales bacterium]
MLVLSRKVGERIHVGNGIVVEVRRVAGNRVTIAVEAPRDMRILRGELFEAATSFEGEQAVPDDEETASSPVVLGHGDLGLSVSSHTVA